MCIHISHSTYLTLCIHLISPASTHLLDSTYPTPICITHTLQCTPLRITLCTHMTPNSKCVLTQHPLHSVYPHNIHFTVCTHTTSNSKCVQPQHPVQSVYPYNIHFSVYPHNIQFKVCTPITSTSVSTHTTSTSQCVPTQHLPTAHLVFSGRSRAASQSGLMMHTHFPLRGWTIYPDSQG